MITNEQIILIVVLVIGIIIGSIAMYWTIKSALRQQGADIYIISKGDGEE